MSNIYNFSLIFMSVLLILQFWVIFYLARYIGDFMAKIESIDGIKVGTLQIDQEVPHFREVDSKGNKIISRDIFLNKTLLLFVNTNCSTCKEIITEIKGIKDTYDISIVVINTDESHDDSLIKRHLGEEVVYLRSNKISRLYSIYKVPYAISIYNSKVQMAGDLKSKKGLWNLLINEDRLIS
jgi:thiol-disulfide isomerase/thioredoxin